MNPYEAMLSGAGASGPEETQLLASRLRGQDNRALLAMLSGDPLLNPVGVMQKKNTMDQAKQLQKAKADFESRKIQEEENIRMDERTRELQTQNELFQKQILALTQAQETSEREAGQTFTTGEREAGEIFQAGESDLGRKHDLTLQDRQLNSTEMMQKRTLEQEYGLELSNREFLEMMEDKRIKATSVENKALYEHQTGLQLDNQQWQSAENVLNRRLERDKADITKRIEQAKLDFNYINLDETIRANDLDFQAKKLKAEAELATLDVTRLGNINKETQSMAKFLQTEGITAFEESFKTADGVLGKYLDVKTGKFNKGASNLPGVGGLEGGVFRWMAGADGREVRDTLAGLRNKLVKAQAGSAVSKEEYGRMAEELGQAFGGTDKDVIRAYIKIRKELEGVKKKTVAGFSKDAQAMYNYRLGAFGATLPPGYDGSPSASAGGGTGGLTTNAGTAFEVIEE